MLLILTADLHLHKWPEHSKLDAKGNHTRLLDGIDALLQILAYAIANNIKVVIIAGDLFHKRAVLDVETFNLAFSTLAKFRKAGIQVYGLDGNHDQATKDGRIHSLEAFRKVGVIVTGRRDLPIAVGSNGSMAAWVSFFPYSDNATKLYESVKGRENPKSIPSTVRKIAVMHHGFKGARVGSALEYVVREPLLPERIGAEGFDFVFSGHYHGRQYLMDNLMYIGSPYEHMRTDKFEGQKGFLVYDTLRNKVKEVPIRAPRFVTVDMATVEDGRTTRLKKHVEGNFVDLVVRRMEDASALVEELTLMGARGVKPIPRMVVVKSKKRLDVDPTMSVVKAMKRYVDWAIRNRKTKLDRSELIKTGREILHELET